MNNYIKDRTVLITGSTDGIGKQTALDLADMGAHLIIHGRNPDKIQSVVNEIKSKTNNNSIDFCIADFRSLEEVRNLCIHIHKKYDVLDVLINNAGVYNYNYKASIDGFEETIAVCHFSHFLLTLSMLDLLGMSSQGRIINVTSLTHAGTLDLDVAFKKDEYSGIEAYAQAKLYNILFSFELAEKLSDTTITVNCVDPGNVDTNLWDGGFMEAEPVSVGAKTSVLCASSPDFINVSGKFYSECKETTPDEIAFDKNTRIKLWEFSENKCGIVFK